MKFREIQNRAKKLGLKYVGVKKPEMIRSIQKAEGNEPCFAAGRTECNQLDCCWREECMGALVHS